MENKYPYYKKTEIRNLLENEHMAPLKKWGQNFLLNPVITASILQAIPQEITDAASTIAEIGPGLGVLSWEIATQDKPYYIFEIDPFFCELIRGNPHYSKPEIHLIEGDVLQNLHRLPDQKTVLYGNLPYHISSEILTETLEKIPQLLAASFLVQKEFATRIVNEMSSLSVFVSAFGRWKIVKTVGPKNFYPVPRVNSAILLYTRFSQDEMVFQKKEEFELLTLFLKTIFWGKRKQIGTSIKHAPFIEDENLKDLILASLSELSISLETRPEQLKKDEIYNLVRIVSKKVT